MIDGMILQYNNNSKTWSPISIKTAIEHSGANIGGEGVTRLPSVDSGETGEDKTVEEVLAEIDAEPLEGDIVFIDNVPYIYNGENWQELVGSSIEERLTLVEQGLAAVDGKIAEAVAAANHLSYVVKETLPIINSSTVGSLTNKIILVPNSNDDEDNKYTEYLLVDNQGIRKFEKLGTFGADLADYVKVGDLDNYVQQSQLQSYATKQYVDNNFVTQSAVGDLNKLLAATGKESTTVIDELVNIYERLEWNPLDQ